MKKLHAMLLLFLFTGPANGQQSALEADTNVRASAFGGSPQQQLNIGDPIPDELWNLPLEVVNHPEGKETITLADYKDKLIIIDFWATWCVPCIRSLGKLDTLQGQFEDRLNIIPITYEDADKAVALFEKKGWSLPTAVNEDKMSEYFPHNTIPHQIWIDSGKVMAITDHNASSAENVSAILSGTTPKLKEKRDLWVDYFEPLDTYAKQRDAKVYYRSTLTGYIDGTGGTSRRKSDNVQVQVFLNRTIFNLYHDAVRIPNNEFIIESRNIEHINSKFEDESKKYCYQLFAPLDTDGETLKSIIINDLNEYFNLNGRFEQREVECYVIQRGGTTQVKAPDTVGKRSFNLKSVLGMLNYSDTWHPDLNRFVNESGYEDLLWAEHNAEIQNLRNDIPALREYLSRYGLALTKAKRELRVFVISDLAVKLN